MKAQRAGLDISDHKIRLISILQRYRRLRIQMFAEIDLPTGAIVNGTIMQADAVVASLRDLLKHRVGVRWPDRAVYLGLPEQHTFISATWLQSTDKEDMEREARKMLPFNEADIYYDVQLQRGLKLASVVASRRTVIDRYLEVVGLANFSVIGIHSEAEAVAKALVSNNGNAEGYIIIDLGTARTTAAFNIFSTVFFSTTYPSVISANTIDQRNLTAVITQLQQYYQEHYSGTAALKKILLCGSGAYVPNIVEWLKTITIVPVELGDPLKNFKTNYISKRLERPLVFTTAIGLALQK